jgi:gliding motility-associated-like protein
MKKITLGLIAILGLSNLGISQVVIDNSNTVEWYVQNVLLGSGVSVANITFNGAPANLVENKVGQFTDLTSTIGLPSGLAMGTGNIALAGDANTSGGQSSGGDSNVNTDLDLNPIVAPNNIYDKCVIEFDFKPTGDTLSFNYSFGSEEYDEYVCSNYNDVFGFFITGNNPSGGTYNSQNIALVPDTLLPGVFTTTPVAINTINNGSFGFSAPDGSLCDAIDPNWASYSIFFKPSLAFSTDYAYDGRTRALPVFALVNCGESYHIKLAVADVGDNGFDSGVFLEAGSFSTNGLLDATTANVPSNISICDPPFDVNFTSGPNPPPESYWEFGDGVGTSTQQNPSSTYADSGSYTVMFVAIDSTACVGTDTAYFNVELIQAEVLDAQFLIPPYDPCQASLSVDFSFTGTGADSLYWSMGDGVSYSDSLAFTYVYNDPGVYFVELFAHDADCDLDTSITDTIRFFPTQAEDNTTKDPFIEQCGDELSIDFSSGNPAPPENYWNFGDGNTSWTIDPTHVYLTAGNYDVLFVAIDSSTCNIADSIIFPVTLSLVPELNVDFDYTPPLLCGQGDYKVNLEADAVGSDSIYWDMGDGTTFRNLSSISYEYAAAGSYTINVSLYSGICPPKVISSSAVFIELEESSGVIPNVFTPNGDGFNDELVFKGVDHSANFDLHIFNRWGAGVFNTTNPEENWDGGSADDGTYFYELRYTDVCENEEKMLTGFITLLGNND